MTRPPRLPSGVRPRDLHGEPFRIAEEGGRVYVWHDQWSLVGAGATADEAVRDMESEAREIAELEDEDNCSAEYNRMMAYCRRVAQGPS